MEEYLELKHLNHIKQIVNASSHSDIDFRALQISLIELSEHNVDFFNRIMYQDNIWTERVKWTKALEKVQKRVLDSFHETSAYSSRCVKDGFPVTFINHPKTGMINHRYGNIYKLVEVNARVLVYHESVKKESQRTYQCRKCKQTTTIFANRRHYMYFDEPNKCSVSRGCFGTMFNTAKDIDDDEDLDIDRYIDFQKVEVVLTDSVDHEVLIVELDEELIDTCFVGDQITILGVIETRSEYDINDFEIVLRAASLRVNNDMQTFDTKNIWEIHCEVYDEWNKDFTRFKGDEFLIRDEMISSVAMELYGLSMVKLALLCVLCSGGQEEKEAENQKNSQDIQRVKQREIVHLLMIGPPGCGKSQIIKAAMKTSLNAVQAVGYSSTAAGLTAAVTQEKGRSSIQAGALVKANNGILCIDELNLFAKEHRSSIHEALEHQMISINKGDVCMKLQAKCSVVAAMNPSNCLKPIETSNLTIEQSLLSRFDLVFELEDPDDEDFDSKVMGHILSFGEKLTPKWSKERLQKHIMIAKRIPIRISKAAETVIDSYFWKCKENNQIEQCRRTMRLFTSLQRLTKCHAKLMLRREAVIQDALCAIMIMEQTWTFGHLIGKMNNVTSTLPLRMSNKTMTDIMNKLQLGELWEEYLSSKFKNTSTTRQSQNIKATQSKIQESIDIDIDEILSGDIKNYENEQKYSNLENVLPDSVRSSSLQESDSQKLLRQNLESFHAMFGSQKSRVEKETKFPMQPDSFQNYAPHRDKKEVQEKKCSTSAGSKLSRFQYESQTLSESQTVVTELPKILPTASLENDDDDVGFHLWSPLNQASNDETIQENPDVIMKELGSGDKPYAQENAIPAVNIDADNEFDLWGGFNFD